MSVFLLELWVLIAALARHIRRGIQLSGLAFLLGVLPAGGTLFYWQMEDWTHVDSLYSRVMTIATVGYGDVVPTKDVSKLFTIGYAVLGIGLFATFVGRLLILMLQQRAPATPSPGEPETEQDLRSVKSDQTTNS